MTTGLDPEALRSVVRARRSACRLDSLTKLILRSPYSRSSSQWRPSASAHGAGSRHVWRVHDDGGWSFVIIDRKDCDDTSIGGEAPPLPRTPSRYSFLWGAKEAARVATSGLSQGGNAQGGRWRQSLGLLKLQIILSVTRASEKDRGLIRRYDDAAEDWITRSAIVEWLDQGGSL